LPIATLLVMKSGSLPEAGVSEGSGGLDVPPPFGKPYIF
jgi:hypothetical protein